MLLFRVQPLAAALLALSTLGVLPLAGQSQAPAHAVPAGEVLSYSVEWRLIHAANARLAWSGTPGEWQAQLNLDSAGMVSRLYKVNNTYSASYNGNLCVQNTTLIANEANRRRETRVSFDARRRKASLVEHDKVKNTTIAGEIDVQACEHDVIGALYQLRTMNLEPGHSAQIPVSDGKRAVLAKVEAQERETVKLDSGTYKTIRYEAFLFDNVLYRRHGRVFVWITDDERRLPVQIRIRLPFYIGTVTLQLEKRGKT